MNIEEIKKLEFAVVGAAFEVRKHLNRFLYEKAYEKALQYELQLRGINSERQYSLPIVYKDIEIQKALIIDLLVEGVLPVEIKSVDVMGKSEVHQILTYMDFGKFPIGLLINFGSEDFCKDYVPEGLYLDKGIYRFISRKFQNH